LQRDRVYLIIDILTKLIEYGEINQSSILLYCRLNLTKHKEIFDELEQNDFIEKTQKFIGKKQIIYYKITPEGLEFYSKILGPYEKFFPRK